MLASIRALVGADGALLLSCDHDDAAVVGDASPPAVNAGPLRIPYELLRNGDGLVFPGAMPPRVLSAAYANWLPSGVTNSALLFAPSHLAGGGSCDSPDGAVTSTDESARTVATGASPHRVVPALLLVWCDRDQATVEASVGAHLPALRSLAAPLLAPAVARHSSAHAAERLAAIMGAAPYGIVFAPTQGTEALVNREAARLLSLPEGVVPAVQLASAMQRVHARLEHRPRVEAEYARMVSVRDAELRDWEWEFAGASQTLWRVSTVPVSDSPSAGRLWTIEDVTADRALRRLLTQHDSREREVTRRQLEAVRTLAADVAHDFSRILTVLGNRVEPMPDARTVSDRETELAVARRSARRGQALVGQLRSFAGRQPSLLAPVPLDDALRALRAPLQALVHELVDAQCALELVLDAADATVVIDERQLSLALLSLVATTSTDDTSAFVSGASVAEHDRSLRPPRPLVIHSERCGPMREGVDVPAADGETGTAEPRVAVRVTFPAPEMSTTSAGRETEGAFSHRQAAAVSTAAALLAPFGGSVRRAAHLDGGHTVMVTFPEAQATRVSQQHTPVDGMVPGLGAARLPILVVDDDVGPRRVIRRLLEREGYDVLTAGSVDDALQQVAACDGALSAVVSDYQMPGKTGMDLLTHLRRRWPRLPVVLVSGFASEVVTEVSMRQLSSQFLPKPFTRQELIGALESASLVLKSV